MHDFTLCHCIEAFACLHEFRLYEDARGIEVGKLLLQQLFHVSNMCSACDQSEALRLLGMGTMLERLDTSDWVLVTLMETALSDLCSPGQLRRVVGYLYMSLRGRSLLTSSMWDCITS